MTLADGRVSDFGVFIKEILPGRLAEKDGIMHAKTTA